MHCTGQNNCSWVKQTPSGKDIFLLMSIFRQYQGLKLPFECKSARISFFCACLCWDSRLSLPEMNQNYNFVGIFRYSDSYLECLFRHFKVIRLHAILHEAAGVVGAHKGKDFGYCYMIGRGPNSCLPGHVTGLLLCLSLPSVLTSSDFKSSIVCNVLDIEFADRNFIGELGAFIDWIVQG